MPHLGARCEECGRPLSKRTGRYCPECRTERFYEHGAKGRAAAATLLKQLRQGGTDPAHGGEAARRRGRKNAAHQQALAGWQPTPGVRDDPEYFRNELLPGLQERPIGALVNATGLSPHYCSLIRLGKRVPHPRHWNSLAEIGGHSAKGGPAPASVAPGHPAPDVVLGS